MNEKILVVEDEKEIADLLEVYLKNDNYSENGNWFGDIGRYASWYRRIPYLPKN